MTSELTVHRRAPMSGTAASVVVFLHGYGADGQDLLGLADPLAPHMPDTLFLAPDAPTRSPLNPMGYQWAPIPHMDGSTMEQARTAMLASVDAVNAMLDGLIAETGLGPEKFLLFGFSQGTMLSLHLAPRRAVALAGVVGFSGMLLVPEVLSAEKVVTLPILLVHGDADEVVPFAARDAAAQALLKEGFSVYAHTMPGTGHGIAPDGLSVALAFMREQFGIS